MKENFGVVRLGLFIVVLGIVLQSGCNYFTNDQPKDIQQIEESSSDSVAIVSATGNLVAKKEAILRFKQNANNIRILVEEGERVNAGDELVQSNSHQQLAAVDEANAQLAAAQLAYEALIREEFREVRQSEKDAAFENIEAAEAALDLAEDNLKATSITAPFSGSVIEVYVDSYENVYAGESILLFADVSSLQIETSDLDEKDAGLVHIGDRVAIYYDAIPNETSTGKVIDIAQKATSGAGTDFMVTISPHEFSEDLRWGMSAYVEIEVGSALEVDKVDITSQDSELQNSDLGEEIATPQERRICEIVDFLSETIPDGTVLEPGEEFTKSWTFRNNGTCTWDTNYKLVFIEGENMNGLASYRFPGYVAPKDLMTIEIKLKAPEIAGEYRGRWDLYNELGGRMYMVWVDIIVADK